jgi:hypothetical protein
VLRDDWSRDVNHYYRRGVGDLEMTKRKPPDQLLKEGRKSTYRRENVRLAQKLAYLGATDSDLADAFGVSIRTISIWKAKHPEFMQALKTSKDQANSRVERSLYQRAVGYSYDSVKIFMQAGAKKPVIVPYVEHVPPDTTAAIFWLKNRDPAHWRDAWQLEASVGRYIISDKPMSVEDWVRERAVVVDAEPIAIEDKREE